MLQTNRHPILGWTFGTEEVGAFTEDICTNADPTNSALTTIVAGANKLPGAADGRQTIMLLAGAGVKAGRCASGENNVI
jgi:hypothetical protein